MSPEHLRIHLNHKRVRGRKMRSGRMMLIVYQGRPIILESKVVEADIQAFPGIHRLFKSHQFEWMNNMLGEYARHLTREAYASYATNLMNFAADTEQKKKRQKDGAAT
ncbi:hypothetical protein KY290_023102 [Solanum tuberosum]|uniref:Uncharacterized protein n=1 Tax=Solanum tuberosum TaxID=4113 RepID=A0ABQ7V7Z5_SOLTU|nr:hypothetical protein KY284_022022 [Solanum tuberosum]KAH0684379.1 hypothetical protein KY289_022131 [Solanum tuberosum]KAH0694795.1 hypothetical protein KY285_021892 [Solanum tuberosum]KAH0759609.1 hypothetical protein KY290_023102 [Solanum tuberosum]